MRNACKILVGKREERDRSRDLGVDGTGILRMMLEKQDGKLWTRDQWRAVVNTVMNLRVL